MKLKRNTKRLMGSFWAVVLALVLTVAMFPAKAAAETTSNKAVQDSSKGILQVLLVWENDDGEGEIIGGGTGFLINSDTLLTCDHVVNPSDELLNALAELKGKDVAKIKKKLSYAVTVSRDVTISATVENSSEAMDFAILRLNQSLQNRNPLAIRPSSSLEKTEMVYGVGFPEQSEAVSVIKKYTSEDATITNGQISQIGVGGIRNTFDFIQTNVKMTSGISGAPMVDNDGYVVGLCQSSTGVDDSGDYFYAIAIDQVTEVLNDLGIDYTLAGEDVAPTDTPEEPTDTPALAAAIADCEALDASSYKTLDPVLSVLDRAKETNNSADATQDQVDAVKDELVNAKNALEPAGKGLPATMIIIIAIVVLIVIALIVLIIAMSNKNKKGNTGNGADASTIPGGMNNNNPAFTNVKPTEVKSSDFSGETGTTVLKGAPPTTQLKRNVNGGTLVNTKTNERVQINAEDFIIGRERTKVNYCVTTNGSVGRIHAKVVVRNGAAYLVDLNAQNGTFVNGTKCFPNQEVALKTGDKVALADEEFTYQA